MTGSIPGTFRTWLIARSANRVPVRAGPAIEKGAQLQTVEMIEKVARLETVAAQPERAAAVLVRLAGLRRAPSAMSRSAFRLQTRAKKLKRQGQGPFAIGCGVTS